MLCATVIALSGVCRMETCSCFAISNVIESTQFSPQIKINDAFWRIADRCTSGLFPTITIVPASMLLFWPKEGIR